ncbi:hypothetical protein HGA88_04050 [Candidatus Roizmanbacteria bacterium]|nr:hypothetical protein [Candidatus Roizmanbacteria bacterium]
MNKQTVILVFITIVLLILLIGTALVVSSRKKDPQSASPTIKTNQPNFGKQNVMLHSTPVEQYLSDLLIQKKESSRNFLKEDKDAIQFVYHQ